MIRRFEKVVKAYNATQCLEINTETGDFKKYLRCNDTGVVFNDYETTVYKMGYETVKELITTLKRRGTLGAEIK